MRAEVELSAEARENASVINAWWLGNRSAAPGLFALELEAVLSLISETPRAGRRYRRAGIPGLRRILLPKSRYHVYYLTDDAAAKVSVVAIWSAVRDRGPKLFKP